MNWATSRKTDDDERSNEVRIREQFAGWDHR